MEQKLRSRWFEGGGYEDEGQSSWEHGGGDSPVGGEESGVTATGVSVKKGRRDTEKRWISVRIGGSRSGGGRGETCPPSDSWAWRKYGQKPIKGSPFPRGYYRCSSSKGCPARKQVERSHADPTMLVVTYAGDHNHTKINSASSPDTPPQPASPEVVEEEEEDQEDQEESSSDPSRELFSCAVEFGLGAGDHHALLDFSWLYDSDVALEGPCFVGPMCLQDADMASVTMREEDRSLFADLDELPECSAVFRPPPPGC